MSPELFVLCLFGMALVIAVLLGMAIERARVQRETFLRQCELEGCKASITDTARHEVIV